MIAPDVSVTVPDSEVVAPPPCASAGTLVVALIAKQNSPVRNSRALNFMLGTLLPSFRSRPRVGHVLGLGILATEG